MTPPEVSRSFFPLSPSAPFWRGWWLTLGLLALVAVPGIDLLLLDSHERDAVQWVDGVWARKFYAQQNAPAGKRLLVVGGSSGAFSVDAELLEARLRVPTYNLSTHAALGLRFLLDDARAAARPGDTILLYLEYAQYRHDPRPVTDLEEQVIWSDRRSRLFHLPVAEFANQVFGLPFDVYQEGWTQRNRRMAANPMADRRAQLYAIDELGPRGDYRSTVAPTTPLPPPLALSFVLSVRKDSKAALEQFFQWCQRRQITVIAARPAAIRTPGISETDEKRAYTAIAPFYAQCHIPLLDTPQIFQLPRELFFDTPYHANAAGRRIISETLARELSRVLNLPMSSDDGPILLVASPASEGRDLVLADRAISHCLFFSVEDLGHPLSITTRGIRQLCAQGKEVVSADPAVQEALRREGFELAILETRKTSIDEWIASPSDHLLALASVGEFDTSILAPGLSADISTFLKRPGYKAAFFGTGRFAKQNDTRVSTEPVELEISADAPVFRGLNFPVGVSLYSGPNASRPPVQLVHFPTQRTICKGAAPGLAIAVLDPQCGRVTRRGVFPDREIVEWQLEKVLPSTVDAIQ